MAEAEEIELRSASGSLCVSDPGCDEIKFINVELNFCRVDPDIMTFTTGSPLVLDFAGDSVGNRIQKGAICSTNFALEVWTDIPDTACTTVVGEPKPYGYFLLPCIGSGIIGDFTIENDALTMQINAKARAASGWGEGPYLVDPVDALNTPGPLTTPIGENDMLDLHLTTIAPPPVVCGCQAMPAAIP